MKKISCPLCFDLKTTLVYGLCFFFFSCFTPRYALNTQEKAFIRNSKYWRISISYDDRAIRKLRSDGVYTIECKASSRVNPINPNPIWIDATARKIATEVVGFMNFKEHHQYIEVVLSGPRANNDVFSKSSDGVYSKPAEYRVWVRILISSIKATN